MDYKSELCNNLVFVTCYCRAMFSSTMAMISRAATTSFVFQIKITGSELPKPTAQTLVVSSP